jgi:hypothetical protein
MRHVEAEKLEEANAPVTTSVPATSPSVPTAVLSPKQGRYTTPVTGGGALTTTSPSIPTTTLPPNQEQPTPPLAGGSVLTTSPSLRVKGLPVERANKTPPTVLRDKRDNDESTMDELREDSATDGQANDAPSWFILSSPADKVKPKVNLEKKLNTTTAADGSNTWERKKGKCWTQNKIGDSLQVFSIARAQAAAPVEQNDVFTSTKGTSIFFLLNYHTDHPFRAQKSAPTKLATCPTSGSAFPSGGLTAGPSILG